MTLFSGHAHDDDRLQRLMYLFGELRVLLRFLEPQIFYLLKGK